jgi:AcrR family transcriptional regulator
LSNAAPQGTRGRARPRNGERETREILLEAAFRCAIRFGWARTRMADVAARAGVSRQTLYRHFKTKETLAAALALRELDAFLGGCREAFRAQESVSEGVVAAAAWSLKHAQAHPLLAQLIEDPDSGLLPYVTTRALPLLRRGRQQMVHLVMEADPRIDPELAHLLGDVSTRMVFSYLVGPAAAGPCVQERSIRMSTVRRYTLPIDQTEWRIPGASDTVFNWEYNAGREYLLGLYEKGKERQWNATRRIDWSQNVDPENPIQVPDEYIPIFGSDLWDDMTDKEKRNARHHFQAWQFSQFLHGEQGALVCTAKIVQQVPDVDAKFYAATQVIDEARHVEVYSRFLHDKLELAYPINPSLKALLNNILSDSRWDMTYLGMQILIEGLALAAFGLIRDLAQNLLACAINAYVMQDEARHVAFGRMVLRDYYPQLTDAERREREQFVVEACYQMRDRFMAEEAWERIGLPVDRCIEYLESSEIMREFRKLLFTRIVPTIRDIGLWGPTVQKGYAEMGVLDFAQIDVQALMDLDDRYAQALDARKEAIERTAEEGRSVRRD